jgi:hypothetical protein
MAKRFWTLSVWEKRPQCAIVGQPPHRQAMIGLRRYMSDNVFTRWKFDGPAMPPSWREGLDSPIKTRHPLRMRPTKTKGKWR